MSSDMNGGMNGRVVVITGATQGIGKFTALALAKMGAEVTIVARSAERGQAVVDEIRTTTANPKIDVLVNNAGAINTTRKVTSEGLELTFSTNHLAYFLLTELLLPQLEAAGTPGRKARIVNVASNAHKRAKLDMDDLQLERGFAAFRAYSNSKVCNLLFTFELARRLAGKNVVVNCLHPGVVATGFGRNDRSLLHLGIMIAAPFFLTPEKGAQTSIHLASAPEVEGVTGLYFSRKKPARSTRTSLNEALARQLWEKSEALVAATKRDRQTA